MLLNSINRTIDSLIQIKIRQDLLIDSRRSLLGAKDACRGRTVFCVGNGPSLSAEQIRLASNHFFVATNRAYQLFEPSQFLSGRKGWLLINDFYRSLEVLPSLCGDFEQVVVGCHDPQNIYLYKVLLRRQWIFTKCAWGFRFNRHGLSCLDQSDVHDFSCDFFRRHYPGWSVIFSAIQFAAYLGAKRIVLVGCDMDYSGPAQYSSLIANDRLSIGHLGQFVYEEHGKIHMIACRDGLRKMGIELYNATPAGAINEIPRITHEELEKCLI